MSLPRWNGKFELPDESYFVVDIQDYFEYVIKKTSKKGHHPPISMYLNIIEIGLRSQN